MLGGLVACALGSIPATARAIPAPPRFVAPHPMEPTPLEVQSEVLHLRCGGTGGERPCAARAEYRIHNPTTGAVDVVLRIDPDAEVQVDGEPRAPDGASKIRIRVATSASRTLVLTGSAPTARPLGLVQLPIRARHPLLGRRRAPPPTQPFVYDRTHPRSWGAVPQADVHVQWRPPSRLEGEGWQRSREGPWHRASRAVPADEPSVNVYLEPPERGFRVPWGAHVGLGTLRDTRDFAMRFGLDVAFHPLAFAQLAVETTFDGYVSTGAIVEAALPQATLWPSLGAGAGLVVRAKPDATAGLRIVTDAVLWGVGFNATFDYFPKDRDVAVLLFGQLGL